VFSGRACAVHDRLDEPLLRVEPLIGVCVETSVHAVAKDFDGRVFVPLTQDAALPLLHVGRAPWRVDVMEGLELGLDVDAGAEFLGAAHDDPDFPLVDPLQQEHLPPVAVVVVDVFDLILHPP